MVITFAMTEQEKEEIERLNYEVSFEIHDILEDSEEELTKEESERLDFLINVRDALDRLVCVAENERMISEKKTVVKNVVDLTHIKSMDELYELIDKMKKSKQEVEHQSNLSMTPMEFSKFMRDWIDAHMDDPELTLGYIERMFKTPASRYQRTHKKK